MYSLFGYGEMIADKVRTGAFVQALRQAVTPNSVVLDIGAGAGIWALLACQLGVRRVYAIEPDDVIQIAREIAVANGYAERIEFIQDMSTRVTLPEQADVIISDLRGPLPWLQYHLPSIADARRRLLAPGGVLIPQRDTVFVAIVNAPDLYRRFVTTPWDNNDYSLDMSAARRIVTNTWRKGRVSPEQLLVEPHSWAMLDYATVESPDISAQVTWTMAREGVAHGLSVWFDATLAEGVGFSNAPGAPELIYGTPFFPWSAPVSLSAGDTVSVTLRADLVGDDYVWGWDSHVLDQGRPGQVKASFKQSTLFGAPLSPAHLRKRAAGHVPLLNEEGQIDRLIMDSMNGDASIGEIARRLLDQFPAHFSKMQDALARVGELSCKYSR